MHAALQTALRTRLLARSFHKTFEGPCLFFKFVNNSGRLVLLRKGGSFPTRAEREAAHALTMKTKTKQAKKKHHKW
jgi:hypothetical protein